MPQIIPIRNLKNTAEISEKCHQVNEPIFVTKNGYGDMVVMSIETYEEYMRKVEVYEQLAVAEAQQESGECIDGFAHLETLKNKYGLKISGNYTDKL